MSLGLPADAHRPVAKLDSSYKGVSNAARLNVKRSPDLKNFDRYQGEEE